MALSSEKSQERVFIHTNEKGNVTMEKQHQRLNREAVEELKRYREEIKRAHPGQVFEDSVELLRQAREERTRELEQRK